MSITLSNFSGINNQASEDRLPEGFLRDCVDFNIDNSGVLSQREGYVLKDNGEFTTLWSDGLRCFAVKNGDLIEVFSDYTDAVLRAGVGRVRLNFAECGGDYYFCGDAVTGCISGSVVKSFGQASVRYQPKVTVVNSGILQAGTYLIAVTTLDEAGRESGTSEPRAFVLTANNKGLQLSDFQTASGDAVHYEIYMSSVDGNTLYRQGTINIDTGIVIIYEVMTNTLALTSFGIEPAPFGQCIAYHYGHLLIANSNRLYYSETMAYHRWHPANHYVYPSAITAILPCENGLWIGTESSGLFWISGKKPSHGMDAQGDFTQSLKHTACLYRGSEQRIEADKLKQLTGGWMATAKEGLFLLLDMGEFVNVSWDNVTLPEFSSCIGAIVSNKDSFNYLAILKGATVPQRTL